MLSLKSRIELLALISRYSLKTSDRIFYVFDIEHLIHPTLGKFTLDDKLNILLKTLKRPPDQGPFTNDFNLDLLQYMVDLYYRNEDDGGSSLPIYRAADDVLYEHRFSFEHQALTYSLTRDGYTVNGRTIKKQLPQEIEEAKSESELFVLLSKFDLIIPKGHLEQAISNHSQANWREQIRSLEHSLNPF